MSDETTNQPVPVTPEPSIAPAAPAPASPPGPNYEALIQAQSQQIAQLMGTVNEMAGHNAALTARMNQALTPQQQAPQLQVPEGTDPALVRMFQQLAQAQAADRQELQRTVGYLQQTQEQMQFAQASSGYPEEVRKMAAGLMTEWKRKNLGGWIPEDALTYAMGQWALKNGGQPKPGPREAGVVNAPPAAAPTKTSSVPELSEDQINRLSLRDQEAYWEARIGKNSELAYH